MSEKNRPRTGSQMSLFVLQADEPIQPIPIETHASDETDSDETSTRTRKGEVQTAWHPLFAEILALYLPPGYRLSSEHSLTREPQRIDVVIWEGDGKGGSIQGLPAVMDRLSHHNLFEFKSPLDTLDAGDYSKLVGYGMQYHAQQQNFPVRELSLFMVASRWNDGFGAELEQWGCRLEKEEQGVYRLVGALPWTTWYIQSDEVATRTENEVLGLFGANFAKEPIVWLTHSHLPNWLPVWMIQQLAAYRERNKQMPLVYEKEFVERMEKAFREHIIAMPREELKEILISLPGEDQEVILQGFSTEERLKGLPAEERLKGLPAEERLKGLPAEERLKGLPAEERLKGLPAEEILQGFSTEERLKGLPAEERLKGLPAEEVAKALSPEEKEQLKKLLE